MVPRALTLSSATRGYYLFSCVCCLCEETTTAVLAMHLVSTTDKHFIGHIHTKVLAHLLSPSSPDVDFTPTNHVQNAAYTIFYRFSAHRTTYSRTYASLVAVLHSTARQTGKTQKDPEDRNQNHHERQTPPNILGVKNLPEPRNGRNRSSGRGARSTHKVHNLQSSHARHTHSNPSTPWTIEMLSTGAGGGLEIFLSPFIAAASHRNHNSSATGATTKTSASQHRKPSEGNLGREQRGGGAGRAGASSSSSHANAKLVLSIFDIPPGLLTRRPVDEHNNITSSTSAAFASSSHKGPALSRADSRRRGLTCIRCDLTFDARPSQLAHFKSDLHMINLRRQLSGEPPISQQVLDDTQDAAAGAAASLTPGHLTEENDSGSDSEPDPDEGGGATPPGGGVDAGMNFSGGLEREAAAGATDETDVDAFDEDDGFLAPNAATIAATGGTPGDSNSSNNKSNNNVRVDFSLQEGPRLTFTPPGSSWSFSLSSAALGMERDSDPWERVANLVGEEGEEGGDEAGGGAANNRLWAVVIVRSGRFAAAVFEGQSVLCHKVFRRLARGAGGEGKSRGTRHSCFESVGSDVCVLQLLCVSSTGVFCNLLA